MSDKEHKAYLDAFDRGYNDFLVNNPYRPEKGNWGYHDGWITAQDDYEENARILDSWRDKESRNDHAEDKSCDG